MNNQITPKQAMRRYVQEFIFAIFLYAFTLIASVTLLKKFEFERGWQIIISIVPALPVIFIIVALMRLLRDSDELQQRVNLLAVTFSAVLTGLISFSYGFLENIGFPKMPTFAVLPMLFVLWGVGLGYFTWKYE
ncbi:MAG: hypothetical protein QM730_20050 [Anaerolineales bacterium]